LNKACNPLIITLNEVWYVRVKVWTMHQYRTIKIFFLPLRNSSF
jgi:hypothetical protein